MYTFKCVSVACGRYGYKDAGCLWFTAVFNCMDVGNKIMYGYYFVDDVIFLIRILKAFPISNILHSLFCSVLVGVFR